MKVFLLSVAAISLLLAGCAGSVYDAFPKQYSVEDTVSITVIRSVKGVLVVKDILLDGTPIAQIARGEYATFRVTPGTHSIGIPESLLAIDYKADKRYYLHLVPTWTWNEPYMRTELINEEQAMALLPEYIDITPKEAKERP